MRIRTGLALAAGLIPALLLLVLVGEVRAQEAMLRIREKVLEFYQALEQKQVDTYVKGRESSFDRVYATYHYLVTPEKIQEVRDLAGSVSNPEEKKAYGLLEQFLIYETIRKASAPELDGGNNYLSQTEIVVGGEEIPLRDVINRMAEEPDRSVRRQWSFAFKEFLENVNVYLRQAVFLSNKAATELGQGGYQDILSRIKDFDIQLAQPRAQALVEASSDLYRAIFEEQIAATYGTEMTLDEVRFYDMPRIWRMSRFDEGLQERRAFKDIKSTFAGVGLSLEAGAAGTVDAEASDRPEARSGVAGYYSGAVRNQAVVGYKPTSGFETYSGMLRECGRLVYEARAGGAYFENHFFGDPTIKFAIGYLFENLMENPDWLKANTKLKAEQIADVRRAHAYHRLFRAREFAGRTQFLPKLYEGIKQPDEVFESIFEPIRMWGHTEVDRIMYMGANDEFDCVAEIKGMILAVAIENMLEKRFGPNWFEQKAAGEALATLWAKGQQQRASEFAASVDLAEFDPMILVDHVKASVEEAS